MPMNVKMNIEMNVKMNIEMNIEMNVKMNVKMNVEVDVKMNVEVNVKYIEVNVKMSVLRGDDGSLLSADQRMMAKKVLDAMLDTITDEKNNKGVNTINSEQKAADIKSQCVHDSLIKGLEKEITDTKAVKVNKEAIYDVAAPGEFNEANKQAVQDCQRGARQRRGAQGAREGSAADGVFDAATRGRLRCTVLEEGDEGAERGVGG
jgi:hypothetical protein